MILIVLIALGFIWYELYTIRRAMYGGQDIKPIHSKLAPIFSKKAKVIDLEDPLDKIEI